MADDSTGKARPCAPDSLMDYDWAGTWRAHEGRGDFPDAGYWTNRAPKFAGKGHGASVYCDQFLAFARLLPGESVLDMGCGAGSLAIPLARRGHQVTAADFSVGMLEQLEGRLVAEPELAGRVTPLLVGWEDDWARAGIAGKSVDVAIASRSLRSSDIAASLAKLSAAARRRACVTLPTSASPTCDAELLKELGLRVKSDGSLQYTFLILADSGYLPEVRYVMLPRAERYESPSMAYEKTAAMLCACVDEGFASGDVTAALAKLKEWIGRNVVQAPCGDGEVEGERGFVRRVPRLVKWAFISWDTH